MVSKTRLWRIGIVVGGSLLLLAGLGAYALGMHKHIADMAAVRATIDDLDIRVNGKLDQLTAIFRDIRDAVTKQGAKP